MDCKFRCWKKENGDYVDYCHLDNLKCEYDTNEVSECPRFFADEYEMDKDTIGDIKYHTKVDDDLCEKFDKEDR